MSAGGHRPAVPGWSIVAAHVHGAPAAGPPGGAGCRPAVLRHAGPRPGAAIAPLRRADALRAAGELTDGPARPGSTPRLPCRCSTPRSRPSARVGTGCASGPGTTPWSAAFADRDGFDADQWRAWQVAPLRPLLTAAAERVPHYRDTWDAEARAGARRGELAGRPAARPRSRCGPTRRASSTPPGCRSLGSGLSTPRSADRSSSPRRAAAAHRCAPSGPSPSSGPRWRCGRCARPAGPACRSATRGPRSPAGSSSPIPTAPDRSTDGTRSSARRTSRPST